VSQAFFVGELGLGSFVWKAGAAALAFGRDAKLSTKKSQELRGPLANCCQLQAQTG